MIIQFIRLYSEAAVHIGYLSTVSKKLFKTPTNVQQEMYILLPEFYFQAAMFMGYIMMSFLFAYILSLMAEGPYILLLRMFTQSREKKKHKLRENVISCTKI